MTSRQVQKLSAEGPRRSASPAMPRWKVWLWRFGRPGTAAPAKRSASPAGDAGLDRRDGAVRDRDQHVVAPAVRQERGREMQLAHGVSGP